VPTAQASIPPARQPTLAPQAPAPDSPADPTIPPNLMGSLNTTAPAPAPSPGLQVADLATAPIAQVPNMVTAPELTPPSMLQGPVPAASPSTPIPSARQGPVLTPAVPVPGAQPPSGAPSDIVLLKVAGQSSGSSHMPLPIIIGAVAATAVMALALTLWLWVCRRARQHGRPALSPNSRGQDDATDGGPSGALVLPNLPIRLRPLHLRTRPAGASRVQAGGSAILPTHTSLAATPTTTKEKKATAGGTIEMAASAASSGTGGLVGVSDGSRRLRLPVLALDHDRAGHLLQPQPLTRRWTWQVAVHLLKRM
jgi:hypothetical protein